MLLCVQAAIFGGLSLCYSGLRAMLEQAIRNFPQQFSWRPRLCNAGKLPRRRKFIVCGMGGSNLTAALLKTVQPTLDLVLHKDYGLPILTKSDLAARLIVVISYSGTTEETLDNLAQARALKLPAAVITSGGDLLTQAQKYHLPYMQLPAVRLQPRMTLGFQFMALSKLLGLPRLFKQASVLVNTLRPGAYQSTGKRLAGHLQGRVPLIYASCRQAALAYTWKIKFNETGKIPAFYNVLPELNHNEMTGFATVPALRQPFAVLLLKDRADHPRVQLRMKILSALYRELNLPVEEVPLFGKTAVHKIFSSLLLADWAAYYTALNYGLEPEAVPMVEEFKVRLA